MYFCLIICLSFYERLRMNTNKKSSWKKFSSLSAASPKTVFVRCSCETDIGIPYTKEFIQFKSKNEPDKIYKIPIEFNDYWQITQFSSENKVPIVEFDIKPQHLALLGSYLNFLPVYILIEIICNRLQFYLNI